MDIDKTENRWFPPSPHKEAVLDFLKKGRAHIEERGHNLPPLLVFEDGGVMELPRARYINGNFSPDESSSVSRQTNYSDVCGTIDEFKRLLKDEPEIVKSDPSRLFELIDDMFYLLSRMQRRREVYREAAEFISNLVEKMNQIKGPNTEDAYQKGNILRDFIKNSPEKVSEDLEYLYEVVEGIRDVANRMESEVLYPYRDLFIELGEIYTQVKGSREWKKKK
ncbi:MAG: hypothetical protein ACPL7B_02200 [Candidatus Poribacteria bacterium]